MVNRMLTKITLPAMSAMITNLIKKIPAVFMVTAGGGLPVAMIYTNQREHDVKATKFEPDCSDIVKDASQFEMIGEPNHGSLSARVVKDMKTGHEYVEKAAHSRKNLVKEFMYANFLHLVRKDQPECLILQNEDKRGTHFHTLSRKYPNSQDIENFIRLGKLNDLKNKKVAGLEESLLGDQIIGKQLDTKLANLIIRETDDEFKISTIDNERAVDPAMGVLNFGRIKFPTQPSVLVSAISDLSYPSADNTSGLAGDPRAKEFGNIAITSMTSEKITDYYADVARADTHSLIQDCFRLAAHSTLFKSKECAQYREHFDKLQKLAGQHVASRTG